MRGAPHNLLRCIVPLACIRGLTCSPLCAAQRWEAAKLPLHYAARYQASEAVVVALLAAHPGAAAVKEWVEDHDHGYPFVHFGGFRKVRRVLPLALCGTACVHTRSHSLAFAVRRKGCCRC